MDGYRFFGKDKTGGGRGQIDLYMRKQQDCTEFCLAMGDETSES